MGWNGVIFHKQRGEARTVVAVKGQLRIGEYLCETMLTNASSRGVMATLTNPPVRGTKVELLLGEHVLPGQVRWRGADCCGIALRDAINVRELIEGEGVPVAVVAERKPPRGPAALLRALVGN